MKREDKYKRSLIRAGEVKTRQTSCMGKERRKEEEKKNCGPSPCDSGVHCWRHAATARMPSHQILAPLVTVG